MAVYRYQTSIPVSRLSDQSYQECPECGHLTLNYYYVLPEGEFWECVQPNCGASVNRHGEVFEPFRDELKEPEDGK